jgi:hypothetical protein
MRQNPSHAHPLLLTNPEDGAADDLCRQGLLMRRVAALVASAQVIADTPASGQQSPKFPRFSFLPRSEGWRDMLMEDTFVFRSPEPANQDGRVGPDLALDVVALSVLVPLFKRKTPFKGG